MLHGLEAADRLTELLANLGVFGGGIEGPPRDTGCLGRQNCCGEIGELLPGHRESDGRRTVECDPRERAGKISCLERFDDHSIGAGIHHHHVLADWE